ncbi:MAG: hypothetical protein M9965_10615 [Anaerolineae bacterium]|nr:hypothetical protein [Anaerolineae bacterium]MCO5195046.1 hypothetical protein [Anaerolineae bacterium]
MKRYEHTQFGTAFTVIVIIVAVLIAWSSFVATGGLDVTFWLMAGFMFVLELLFGWLRVSVDNEVVEARMGIGLVRKRIPLREIVSCRIEHLAWYNGIGLRYTQYGRVYTVSGRQIVVLDKVDDSTFGIGSNEPDALCRAITDAVNEQV